MAKAIHMMVRVLDLDRSIAFYSAPRSTSTSRTGSSSTASPSSTCATPRPTSRSSSPSTSGRTEPYALGDGYGHVAFASTTSTPCTPA